MTDSAIDAIERLAPGEGGVRLYASDPIGDADERSVQVEVVANPGSEDQVLEAEGAQLFLEPNAGRLLDDKILDAALEGTRVQFILADQH